MKYKSLFILMMGLAVLAQETFPVNDVKDERSEAYALTGVTLFVDYQTKVDNATLLVADGRIQAAGAGLSIPPGYTTLDMKGKHIYPSLIDAYSQYGMPKTSSERGGSPWNSREIIDPQTPGAYNANDAIKAQFNAGDVFTADEKEAASWREQGFGTVLTFQQDGIARGTSAVVTLGDQSDNESLVLPRAAAHYSLNKGTSRQLFPVSDMGAVSLLRQTHLDAQWYDAQKTKPFIDQTLQAFLDQQDLPQVFEANSWQRVLLADDVGDEFGVRYIIKGAGDEYRRLDAIKAADVSLIVPLDFPDAPDVDDPLESDRVTLTELKHWELAPANAAMLNGAGIEFALTSFGIEKKKDFWKNLRRALEQGLSKEAALKALTMTPAKMLGISDRVGSLEKGKLANFFVADGSPFEKGKIWENWVQGKRFVFTDATQEDYRGNYSLQVDGKSYDLVVKGQPGAYKASLKSPEKKKGKKAKKDEEASGPDVEMSFSGELVTLVLTTSEKEPALRMSGWRDGNGFAGTGERGEGARFNWKASFKSPLDEKKKDKKDKKKKAEPDLGKVIYPFLAYGWEEAPKQETLLITGATVWTNEADGILENSDVLVKDGKIAAVGQGLKAKGARVIDGKGMHLTPGIIDEHSHIALFGTNDVATNNGMVRMRDVVNSDDVNIYRNLAGGVVAAQLLHGSASPVGGQSALVKMRWGSTPREMLIEGADPFIKFALGENVKRSSNSNSVRFPQTRMGVEQVYRDTFTSALEYEKEHKAYAALSASEKAKTVAPRRDLLMESMLQIVKGERFITCHSYVQSEINMLMHVAEDFGFRVNTFTHILEGYKVADKMAQHGVGASTFADWWAYKWEVRYAIPYNATLMHNQNVVTAINSDSAEMSRRLNQEAAKSVKYGGMSEEDALKMVTLNPAKLLHLDDHMGSIKVGKDADLVLWSDHPLSIYARVDTTMVDGTVYYDQASDQRHRDEIAAERSRLINKINQSGEKGAKGDKGDRSWGESRIELHCDTIYGLGHGGAH